MKFARVIGTLVASTQYKGLEGVKFLVVQELDRDLQPSGEPLIACDATAQAGPGMLTYMIGGREAALALPETFVPVDHTIVGIIDEVDRPDLRRHRPIVRWYRAGEQVEVPDPD